MTVKYNDTSYFAVVTTSSWLRKTTVGATLSPEKSRQFVGNSPGACMFYVDQVLLSGNCADLYSQLSEHVPGNNRLPTYKRSVPTITDGVAEGVVSVGQQTIVVLRAANGSGHVGYVLANNFSLANGVLLPDLDNGKTYTVQSFKTGFVAYDDPLGQILYYPTLNAKPSEISIPKPKDKSLLPTALRISGDQIMLAYSNASGEVAASGLDKEVAKPPKKVKTTILVAGQAEEYGFALALSSFSACGSQKLCLVSDNKLSVYDIAGTKAKYLFSVANVQAIMTSGKQLLVVNGDGVLNLDVDKRVGSLEFSLGNYSFCGLKPASGGYLLCVTNIRGKSAALYIEQGRSNVDNIDKKVAELLKISAVNDVSIYKTFIYVSPDLGQPVLDGRTYGYPVKVRQAAHQQINDAVRSLGINTSSYQVIDTIP